MDDQALHTHLIAIELRIQKLHLTTAANAEMIARIAKLAEVDITDIIEAYKNQMLEAEKEAKEAVAELHEAVAESHKVDSLIDWIKAQPISIRLKAYYLKAMQQGYRTEDSIKEAVEYWLKNKVWPEEGPA